MYASKNYTLYFLIISALSLRTPLNYCKDTLNLPVNRHDKSEEKQLLQTNLTMNYSDNKSFNDRCYQCTYEWKYKKNDEDDDMCCNPADTPQRLFCSTNNIRGKCITCFMFLSLTFTAFAGSNINDDGSLRKGCIYCIDPEEGFYGCVGLGLLSLSIGALSTIAPCCNQKAWDNGDYCNRCVKKQH